MITVTWQEAGVIHRIDFPLLRDTGMLVTGHDFVSHICSLTRLDGNMRAKALAPTPSATNCSSIHTYLSDGQTL